MYNACSLVAQRVERLPAMWETRVRSLGQEDPLEKEMVAHSSVLAWEIPWAEESMGSKRVGHESDITFTFKVLDKILFFFNSRRPVS